MFTQFVHHHGEEGIQLTFHNNMNSIYYGESLVVPGSTHEQDNCESQVVFAHASFCANSIPISFPVPAFPVASLPLDTTTSG